MGIKSLWDTNIKGDSAGTESSNKNHVIMKIKNNQGSDEKYDLNHDV